jgi:hypothetical protein
MANSKHIAKLKEGVEVWNSWRKKNPNIRPQLRGAKLQDTDLETVNLNGADLRNADLRWTRLRLADIDSADLSGATLGGANLTEAQISGSNLQGAALQEAILRNANLSWTTIMNANLDEADLKYAFLDEADLSYSNLYGVSFAGAMLRETKFTESLIGTTEFANVDLSQARGLETVRHIGPSTVGIDTIYLSKGNFPEVFLRKAGVPENFITYMRSFAAAPLDYYSCFISYSHINEKFVQRLYADLQARNVRCWYAPEDLKIGDKFRQRIDEAIRIYDKLLVVLSENSIQSSWVEDEVEGALEKERQQNKLALFPVRLDNAVMKTDQAWAANLRRTRHIADFTKWKSHDSYQSAFKRLLRDLQGKDAAAAGSGTTP